MKFPRARRRSAKPRWAERPAAAQRFCEGYSAVVALATGENSLFRSHEAEKRLLRGAAARRVDLQTRRNRIQQVLPFISLCEDPQIDPFFSPFSCEMGRNTRARHLTAHASPNPTLKSSLVSKLFLYPNLQLELYLHPQGLGLGSCGSLKMRVSDQEDQLRFDFTVYSVRFFFKSFIAEEGKRFILTGRFLKKASNPSSRKPRSYLCS